MAQRNYRTALRDLVPIGRYYHPKRDDFSGSTATFAYRASNIPHPDQENQFADAHFGANGAMLNRNVRDFAPMRPDSHFAFRQNYEPLS